MGEMPPTHLQNIAVNLLQQLSEWTIVHRAQTVNCPRL